MRSVSFLKLVFVVVCSVAAFAASGVAVMADDSVSARVAGRIVLNVDGAGEAFYVSPADGLRYSLGRPEQAFALMHHFGLGISNANLALIPRSDASAAGNAVLRQRLAGRILLQVESHGEAWYVNPVTLRREYLGRPQDAFELMRSTGLGVSMQDLQQIKEGVVVAESINNVPFYAQAPLGNWSDLRQQEGCEEASVLMAVDWAKGQTRSAQDVEAAIIEMSEFERTQYGSFVDTSAEDTFDRLMIEQQEFFGGEYLSGIDATDVLRALADHAVVVLPVNGILLENPYFQDGGPARHMIVVYGYDHVRGEFITHEPGTARGEAYRYNFHTLDRAINDYDSGNYKPLPQPKRTAMILVSPE